MPANIRRLLLFCALVLFTHTLVDIVLFRYLYPPIMEFNSGAGFARFRVQSQANSDESPDVAHAVIVGNSRISEAFSQSRANEAARESKIHFTDLSVPSTTLRVWNYLIKASDPTANRFDFILIPLPSYSAFPSEALFADDRLDLDYLPAVATFADTSEIAGSYQTSEARQFALRVMLFKSFAFRYDIRDLFMRFQSRFGRDPEAATTHWTHLNNYAGRDASIAGLMVDLNAKTFALPPGADPINEKLMRSALGNLSLPTLPQNVEYYRYWLEQIAKRYADPEKKIVLFQIPLHPFAAPIYRGARLPFLDELPPDKFVILPDDLFYDLASPDYFFDAMHMNRSARHIVTQRLTEAVIALRKEASR